MKTAWKKARERAGVPALMIHDSRRTAVRNMTRAEGVSEKRAMEGTAARNQPHPPLGSCLSVRE